MSTLGTLYVAMEENKTDLEKILELYQEAKQIKYLYDEKFYCSTTIYVNKSGKEDMMSVTDVDLNPK